MLQKMIFDNSTGEMFYYSSFFPSDEYLDETKYTVKEVDSDAFDSSLIYYLEDGEVKTKSGDTVERRKSIEDAKKAWEAQEYARNRETEYPSIAELTVALYDTDDKVAIETKRAAVKAKYPKPS